MKTSGGVVFPWRALLASRRQRFFAESREEGIQVRI
jgi:hypothetical protein